jgi:hypothetical protein
MITENDYNPAAKTNLFLLDADTLRLSKKNMNKLIRQYQRDVRLSSDHKYINARMAKIALLQAIVEDLRKLIDIVA